MSLYLSASSIKDFLVCKERFRFRHDSPELAIQTIEMALGEIVHKVIEDNWKDKDKGLLQAGELFHSYNITEEDECDKVLRCIFTFYRTYKQMLQDDDLIEYKFKLPIGNDVYIVGKMDRVNKDNGILIDWKSSNQVPYNIDNDIQFIIYHWAFKKLFNREPSSVILAGLNRDRLVRYRHHERYENNLFNTVIPGMVEQIKHKNYYKDGLYNNGCKNCVFLTSCWGEM